MEFLSNWLKSLFGTKKSTRLENVVVGKILEIEKHPNADRLQLVKVQTSPQPSPSKGEGDLQVVCGAPNIKVGQMVPVALVGAKLAGGMEIKEAEIRGVKSFGMLCAEDELGLGTSHDGIMILNEKAKIGMEFEKYISLNK
jgi:phenylalanyl-tRNA synthetase beta chain